jgi:hypothetical protein
MSDSDPDEMEVLRRSLADLEQACRQAPGTVRTVEYRTIRLHVTRRFVLADLAPLAFFHLVEHIEGNTEAAILRLYDRLLPLLFCEHQWTALKRLSDEHLSSMGANRLSGGIAPQVCKLCTAYALSGVFPVRGRGTPLPATRGQPGSV